MTEKVGDATILQKAVRMRGGDESADTRLRRRIAGSPALPKGYVLVAINRTTAIYADSKGSRSLHGPRVFCHGFSNGFSIPGSDDQT